MLVASYSIHHDCICCISSEIALRCSIIFAEDSALLIWELSLPSSLPVMWSQITISTLTTLEKFFLFPNASWLLQASWYSFQVHLGFERLSKQQFQFFFWSLLVCSQEYCIICQVRWGKVYLTYSEESHATPCEIAILLRNKLSLNCRCSYAFTCNLLLSMGVYIQRSTQFCREAGCFQITLFNKRLFEKLLSRGCYQKSTFAPIVYQLCYIVNYPIPITTDGVQQLDDVSYRTIWILLADAFAEIKAEECTGAFLLSALLSIRVNAIILKIS